MIKINKKYILVVWLLFIASICIKTYLALKAPGPVLYGDELLYKKRAHEIAFFHIYGGTTYPPMYALLISIGFLGGTNFYMYMKFINVVVTSLTIFGVWKLARLFLNEKKSLACVGLSILFPWQYMITNRLISENLFVPLLIITCYYFMRNIKYSTVKSRCFLGVLFVILHLTRHVTLVFLPIFLIIWFIDKSENSKWRICLKKERVIGAVQIVFAYFTGYIIYILYMLSQNNTIMNIFGFSLSAGVGSEQIKEYATLGSLMVMIILYLAYGMLSYNFMLPVCNYGISKSIKGDGDVLQEKYTFLTCGLVLMSFVASIRHSWRNAYNYPEVFHILGRYLWPLGILVLILFIIFLSDYMKTVNTRRIINYFLLLMMYVLAIFILIKKSFIKLNDLFLSDFNTKDIYFLEKYNIYWFVIILWILGIIVLILKKNYIQWFLITSLFITLGVGSVSACFYDEFENDGLFGKQLSNFNDEYNLGNYDFIINGTPTTSLGWDIEFWTMESKYPILPRQELNEVNIQKYYKKYYPNIQSILLINGLDIDEEIANHISNKKGIVYRRTNDNMINEPLIKFESGEEEYGIYEYPIIIKSSSLEIETTYPHKLYYTKDNSVMSNGELPISFQTNQSNMECTIYIDQKYYTKAYINENGIAAFNLSKIHLTENKTIELSYKLYEDYAESNMSQVVEIPVVSKIEISQSYPEIIDEINGFNIQPDGRSALALQTNIKNEILEFYIDNELMGEIPINESGIGAISLPAESYQGKEKISVNLEMKVDDIKLISNKYIVEVQ